MNRRTASHAVVQLNYSAISATKVGVNLSEVRAAEVLSISRRFWLYGFLLLVLGAAVAIASRAGWLNGGSVPAIALIPQATGTMIGDLEFAGASAAAQKEKLHLYWTAPTSEQDATGQGALIDRVARRRYEGIILAPNHPLAIIAPARRVIAAKLPLVVISADLDLPPGGNYAYVLNDERKMGQMAAAECARLLKGSGTILLAGVGRNAPGVMQRARSAEEFLAAQYPGVHVLNRIGAPYHTLWTEEATGRELDAHNEIRAIVTFTAISTRGALAALRSHRLQRTVSLIGCEQDGDLTTALRTGDIAAIIGEDSYRMAYNAVEIVASLRKGRHEPRRTLMAPITLTKENIDSAAARPFLALDRIAQP